MTTVKQINYIKTMLSQACRRTKQEFEDADVMLNKLTPDTVIQHWIKRLESEVREDAVRA